MVDYMNDLAVNLFGDGHSKTMHNAEARWDMRNEENIYIRPVGWRYHAPSTEKLWLP